MIIDQGYELNRGQVSENRSWVLDGKEGDQRSYWWQRIGIEARAEEIYNAFISKSDKSLFPILKLLFI